MFEPCQPVGYTQLCITDIKLYVCYFFSVCSSLVNPCLSRTSSIVNRALEALTLAQYIPSHVFHRYLFLVISVETSSVGACEGDIVSGWLAEPVPVHWDV